VRRPEAYAETAEMESSGNLDRRSGVPSLDDRSHVRGRVGITTTTDTQMEPTLVDTKRSPYPRLLLIAALLATVSGAAFGAYYAHRHPKASPFTPPTMAKPGH
jgi:hypothetical protein